MSYITFQFHQVSLHRVIQDVIALGEIQKGDNFQLKYEESSSVHIFQHLFAKIHQILKSLLCIINKSTVA